MIAGFIFLRLRGILGKKTGHEENVGASFAHDFPLKKEEVKKIDENNFDEKAKADFLKGAKIAYESIVTSFSSGELKNIKSLLDKKVLTDFNQAIKDRKEKGLISETTFIGISSADIKDFGQNNNMFEVTVDFVSEIISCVKDKEKKLISGDPEKVKKVYDTWKFSREIKSLSPNWLLVDTQA
jgi:predicted lipid-binding transport protein (Tim44 family)